MTELQEKILKIFFGTQCDEDEGYMHDECTAVNYCHLQKDLNLPKDVIKKDLIELRNNGIVHLLMTVNYDYIPSGSGWFLTEKGEELVKKLFIKTI